MPGRTSMGRFYERANPRRATGNDFVDGLADKHAWNKRLTCRFPNINLEGSHFSANLLNAMARGFSSSRIPWDIEIGASFPWLKNGKGLEVVNPTFDARLLGWMGAKELELLKGAFADGFTNLFRECTDGTWVHYSNWDQMRAIHDLFANKVGMTVTAVDFTGGNKEVPDPNDDAQKLEFFNRHIRPSLSSSAGTNQFISYRLSEITVWYSFI